MNFIFSAAAPPPSPPQPAAPSSSLLCRNPGPRWSSSKVISRQLKLAGATAATPLRRRRPQQQVASAAEPSAGAKKIIIIPPSPASGRLRRSSRIQSRRSSNSPVPERRRRRRRNAPYFNWGCNPAIIQAPGEKRKYSCASACYCPAAWGAKRARSPICGDADVKPADPPPVLHPQVDWANLGDGPAGLIAEFALANDVADYVRFRAVCRPWRRCSPDPRAGGLDGRFLPRRWIMLDTATPRRRRRFLNIATGECIQMDLPELAAEHRFVALTPEGLLLLLHEPTLVVRLLNPLTRQLIDLPPVTTLLPEDQRAKPRPNIIGDEVYGAGLAGASTVVVSFYDPKVLAFANPGDDCWTVVYNGNLHSTLPFAGRFYCCVGKRVMVLDMDQQPPLLREAVERTNLFYFSQMAHSLHLVDNAGELMLVYRSLHQDDPPEHNRKMKYDVYRVDLDFRTLVPVKGFNGRAVFLGWDRTVSVAAEAFPSITADTLYPGSDIDESKTIGRCNLADGSNCASSNLCEPYTVIDCLSYCIQGTGKELV